MENSRIIFSLAGITQVEFGDDVLSGTYPQLNKSKTDEVIHNARKGSAVSHHMKLLRISMQIIRNAASVILQNWLVIGVFRQLIRQDNILKNSMVRE